MPIDYRIDRERGINFAAFNGVVTAEEVLAFRTMFLADPDWSPGYHMLGDLTQVTDFQVSPDEVESLARQVERNANRFGTGKLAAIVPESFIYGMLRMYQLFSEGDPRTFEIFRSSDAALAWILGPPEPGDHVLWREDHVELTVKRRPTE